MAGHNGNGNGSVSLSSNLSVGLVIGGWGYLTWQALKGTGRLLGAFRKPKQSVRVCDIACDFGWACGLGLIGYTGWSLVDGLFVSGIRPDTFALAFAGSTALVTLATVLHMFFSPRFERPVVVTVATLPALPAGAARPSNGSRRRRHRRPANP